MDVNSNFDLNFNKTLKKNNDKIDEFKVSKSNYLIYQNLKLGLNEQKLIVAMSAMIQPTDKEFHSCLFKISELAKKFDIKEQTLYTDIKKITRNLLRTVVFIKSENKDKAGGDIVFQSTLISTAIYKTGEGVLELRFNKEVAPFFLELKEYFTTYKVNGMLKSRSKYSIHLLEILKSKQFKRERYSVTISKNTLRKVLGIEAPSYEKYNRIKEKVILPALTDINAFSDIEVLLGEPQKDGRKAVGFVFHINLKEGRWKLKKEELIEKYGEDKLIKAMSKIKYDKNIQNYWSYVEGVLRNNEKIKNNNSNANFKERDYDFDDLEKKLLGWDD